MLLYIYSDSKILFQISYLYSSFYRINFKFNGILIVLIIAIKNNNFIYSIHFLFVFIISIQSIFLKSLSLVFPKKLHFCYFTNIHFLLFLESIFITIILLIYGFFYGYIFKFDNTFFSK